MELFLIADFWHSAPAARIEMVGVLGSYGGEQAVEMLTEAFTDSNVDVRAEVCRALVSIGGKKALAVLDRALSDPNWLIRAVVVDELGFMRGSGKRSAPVLGMLEKAIYDNNAEVRARAVASLINIRGAKAKSIIQKARGDPNELVRNVVGRALYELGP